MPLLSLRPRVCAYVCRLGMVVTDTSLLRLGKSRAPSSLFRVCPGWLASVRRLPRKYAEVRGGLAAWERPPGNPAYSAFDF